MTLYETLEVSEGASKETIHAAYKSLAKRFHPDVASTPAAASRMALITEAYSVLSNDEQRKQYDGQLKEIREKKSEGARRSTHGNGQHQSQYQAPPSRVNGMAVEDFALGLLEAHLLPVMPSHIITAYPLAKGDIRTLISIGLERLVH
jgi:DnaJ-class molecular chaperone